MKKFFLYLILVFGLFLSIYPFIWVIINATWDKYGVFKFPPHSTFGTMGWENFANLDKNVHISKVFFNSCIVALIGTTVALIVSVGAGYAFAKFRFYGRNILFSLYLFSMMIPYQATMVPLFRMFLDLELGDTYTALILPGLCNIFIIFLLRQSLLSFPNDLLEAARMDGANEARILLSVVLPNMKPALAAAGIFLFMSSWNNFMWPLIITYDPEMRTLPVALASLKGVDLTEYGQIMMGISIATIPIMVVFMFLSKYFIAGILGTGSKG